MSVEIREGRSEDFEELVAAIDASFQYGPAFSKASMKEMYPHLFQPAAESMRNHMLACESGRILANVSVFPMEMVIEDAHLSAGGIGMVGTLPEARGRGLMTGLLEAAIARMESDGMDLSILGGDRQRYGKFGWENSGRRLELIVNERSIRRGTASDCEVRKAAPEDAAGLKVLHDREALRFERTLDAFRGALARKDYTTWIAVANGDIAAYVVVEPPGIIGETGGEPGAIVSAIGRVLEMGKESGVRVEIPMRSDERTRALLDVASRWNVRQGWMIRIMDLESVLMKLGGVLARKARKAGGGLRGELSLEDSEAGKSVLIRSNGDGVEIAKGRAETHLVLSKRELVRIIFGTIPTGDLFAEGSGASVLDALFPVDYFVGSHDHF